MEINSPDAHAEITDAFQRYVDAINANDIDTVIALFWNSEQTLRYGGGENLYGIDEIKAFRNGQRGKKIKLEVTRLVITAFGPEFGTANCELRYLDTGTPGRMSHTWVRFSQGWRIVAAHVSPGPAA